MLIHLLIFKSDVIGIVTAVSNIFTIRAKGKENDIFKRVVTIRSSRLVSIYATTSIIHCKLSANVVLY